MHISYATEFDWYCAKHVEKNIVFAAALTALLANGAATSSAEVIQSVEGRPFHRTVTVPAGLNNGTFAADAHRNALANGGPGSLVTLDVYGKGVFVNDAQVTHTAGVKIEQLCGVVLELRYTEANGSVKVETSNTPCSIGAAWAKFNIKKNLQDGSDVCARSKSNDVWSNYACITIHA